MTCNNGFASSVGSVTYVEGTKTCQQACEGSCCVGDDTYRGDPINSCTGFNGKVCKSGDIPSCSDNRTSGEYLGKACYNANITEVVNRCIGLGACASAGYNGDLGRVVNRCHGGDSSCYGAAYNGGYIKEIVDSCIGGDACNQAARDGFIGYINHGCRGVKACQLAAYYLSIDGISYVCNNIQACEDLANGYFGYDSIDSAVVLCCNGASECTGEIVDASGLPNQCGTSSPTSSPTTEVRMLSHALYTMLYIQFTISISNHHTYLFIFRP